MTSGQDSLRELHRLARAWGVRIGYDAAGDRRVRASPETLLAVLAALGAPVARMADVPAALVERRADRWRTPIEPVLVAWNGLLGPRDLLLPTARRDVPLRLRLVLEDGREAVSILDLAGLKARRRMDVDGESLVELRCPMPDVDGGALPFGSHGLFLEGAMRGGAHVVSAPSEAPDRLVAQRRWGAFLPLYALREGTRSFATFGSLRRLAERVADWGGGALATLPLLDAFLDGPAFEPSPYSPVTHLAWNALHVELEAEPEWDRAGRHATSPPVTVTPSRQPGPIVDERIDYAGLWAAQRHKLQAMADELFVKGGARRDALEALFAQRPHVRDYARFRATAEHHGCTWQSWPELGSGPRRLPDHSVDPAAYRLHAYAQFVADGQMEAAAALARQRGLDLILDLPLGVHGAGFEPWRSPQLYAQQTSAGAPPDGFFKSGQDWGFPPWHPHALRADGYGVVIDALRHHLRHATALRIDHVLSFQRMYWIPQGLGASHGVYVDGYPEERWAVTCLEAWRSGATIVGEDLGTVPRHLRAAMARHHIQRLHVEQFALGNGGEAPGALPAAAVASLNTHDTPTFEGFRTEADVDDALALGQHDKGSAGRARTRRRRVLSDARGQLESEGLLHADAPERELSHALLRKLCAGHARLVLVNLEDLWHEARPHNIPGTHRQRPNWRRWATHDLDQMEQLAPLLRELGEQRVNTSAPADAGDPRSCLAGLDLHLLTEDRHDRLAERLGARVASVAGVRGLHFAVWAPDARAVHVESVTLHAEAGTADAGHTPAPLGDRRGDPCRAWLLQAPGRRLHTLRHPAVFEGFVPGARPGIAYRYRIEDADGCEHERLDPFAPDAVSAADGRRASLLARLVPAQPWLREGARPPIAPHPQPLRIGSPLPAQTPVATPSATPSVSLRLAGPGLGLQPEQLTCADVVALVDALHHQGVAVIGVRPWAQLAELSTSLRLSLIDRSLSLFGLDGLATEGWPEPEREALGTWLTQRLPDLAWLGQVED